MQLSTTIYGEDMAARARLLRETGFDACDYGAPMMLYGKDKTFFALPDDEFDARFLRDGEAMRAAGLRVRQVHAPFDTIPENESEAPFMRAAILRSVRAASLAGGEVLVIHPAQPMHWKTDLEPEKTLEYNRVFFTELLEEAHRWQVRIALENMPGAGIPTGTPDSLIALIDTMKDPEYFGACFDSGHANYSRVACGAFLRKLGSRLMVVHLHDNRGTGDDHTCPFQGNIDWEDLAEALHDIGYQGTFSFEANFPTQFPEPLRRDALRFLRSVGAYLCERHGL